MRWSGIRRESHEQARTKEELRLPSLGSGINANDDGGMENYDRTSLPHQLT